MKGQRSRCEWSCTINGKPVRNYRPRSEASEGYVFTGVCHSVTERGGGEVGNINGQPPPPPSLGPGQNIYPLPPWEQVRTSTPSPPPGTRSQHLPPPPSGQQHLPPTPLDNSTYPPPPLWTTAPTPPPLTVNGRAIRILLECILVTIVCLKLER